MRIMRVVLDTNVVISAFLSPFGKPAFILYSVLAQYYDIYVNTAVISEYEQVLLRSKFIGKVGQTEIRRFFDFICDYGIYVCCPPSKVILQDESDRVFYDIAKASSASLITGNKKHFPNESFIFTPAEFLDNLHIP